MPGMTCEGAEPEAQPQTALCSRRVFLAGGRSIAIGPLAVAAHQGDAYTVPGDRVPRGLGSKELIEPIYKIAPTEVTVVCNGGPSIRAVAARANQLCKSRAKQSVAAFPQPWVFDGLATDDCGIVGENDMRVGISKCVIVRADNRVSAAACDKRDWEWVIKAAIGECKSRANSIFAGMDTDPPNTQLIESCNRAEIEQIEVIHPDDLARVLRNNPNLLDAFQRQQPDLLPAELR